MSGVTDVPLTAEGHREAMALAEALLGEPAASMVYTSPLRRALATAERIAAGSGREVRTVLELREIDCGSADGLPLSEVRRRFAAPWEANLRQDDPDFRWPGGESYREFRARCLAAIRAIARERAGERTLVVTHSGVIAQVLGAITGASPAAWEPHRPGTASITEVELAAGGGRVIRFDDRVHLRHLE